jgi:outer membrane protein TolC
MSHRLPSLLLAALVSIAGAPLRAQQPSSPGPAPPSPAQAAPPVEELVAAALARAPMVQARAAALAASREREGAAGALADPMLEGMLQNAGLGWSVGDEEMSMLAAELRQELPWPGKRGAARAVAAAETAVGAAALEASRRDVAVEVRTLYARLFALDRERETLLASRELVDLFTETARSRYATGAGEQEGVIKAGIAALRVEERLADLAAERASMVADLNRWRDLPGAAALGNVAALPAPPLPAADLEQHAAELAPEVVTAAAMLLVAERRLDAARLDLKPDLSVGGGAGYRGDHDPMLLLRAGVELPWRKAKKQLPLVRAAEQEAAAARHQLADARAMARAEAARHLIAFRTADEQVRRLREGILPQADAALDAARSSYLAGRGDFSTVIEDFDLWLAARVELARREAERYSAWAILEHHVGALHASHPDTPDIPKGSTP